MAYPTAMRDLVYELRAQGLTTRDIASTLSTRFPDQPIPDHTAIWRWLTDPEANALVKQAETRIRAIVTQQTADVIADTYGGYRAALGDGDYRAVDAYSRAIVNLTRGFVQERVEVTTSAPDDDNEFLALMKRHGMSLRTESDAPRKSL